MCMVIDPNQGMRGIFFSFYFFFLFCACGKFCLPTPSPKVRNRMLLFLSGFAATVCSFAKKKKKTSVDRASYDGRKKNKKICSRGWMRVG